jgi:hypothetical protein
LQGTNPKVEKGVVGLLAAPLKTEGPMRLLIMIATAIVVIAIGYTIKSAMFPSSTVTSLTVAAPAATLSPHEIHLNYKAMKELPVHDSTNAN